MVITLNSSNPKSERYFWLNSDFNEGNIKHKKWRTDSCESILRFSDPEGIRTPNRQSRNLIFYPVELLGHLFKTTSLSLKLKLFCRLFFLQVFY